MPAAREVLDLLTRDELLHLIDRHGVTVRDRRQKAQLAEQLAAKGTRFLSWSTSLGTG